VTWACSARPNLPLEISHTNLGSFQNEKSPAWHVSFTSADLPLGFLLIYRQHQEDFGEREPMNRVVRDLKHG
jgi:hypothetical protein